MNPSLQTTKDFVKIAAFIDSEPLHYYVKFHNLRYFMNANQDSQRLASQRPLFCVREDLFAQYKTQIDANRKEKKPIYEGLPPQLKQVSMDSTVQKDVEIGEKAQVSKSCVGRGVKIGARSKIVNSVIMNNVVVGNE
jgi:NDP-sugar pyrophosphorylase family protein